MLLYALFLWASVYGPQMFLVPFAAILMMALVLAKPVLYFSLLMYIVSVVVSKMYLYQLHWYLLPLLSWIYHGGLPTRLGGWLDDVLIDLAEPDFDKWVHPLTRGIINNFCRTEQNKVMLMRLGREVAAAARECFALAYTHRFRALWLGVQLLCCMMFLKYVKFFSHLTLLWYSCCVYCLIAGLLVDVDTAQLIWGWSIGQCRRLRRDHKVVRDVVDLAAEFATWGHGAFNKSGDTIRFWTLIFGLRFTLALFESQLFTDRHRTVKTVSDGRGGTREVVPKSSRVLKSTMLLFARFVEDAALPSFIRRRLDPNALSFLDQVALLRDMNYPVMDDLQEQDPIPLCDGKYDGWLVGGTNWQTHQPRLRAFVQHEFDNFRKKFPEFRNTFTYANLDNQLEATSRYFREPNVEFPLTDEVFKAIWDTVKPIYQNSRITPLWAIYKAWNKKYNVGVLTSSRVRNKFGGIRKMKRREDIARFTSIKEYLDYWQGLFERSTWLSGMSQFFTKLEYLPPKKWLVGKIRTPVASLLPQYLSQMVISAAQNHRTSWISTPIKAGMSLTGSALGSVFSRHSVFDKHFAGDCTAFDSSITGAIVDMVKAVRKKGFELHKELGAISYLVDENYRQVHDAWMVSANSGNIYRKRTGLMTGHASQTSDNSLVMVAMYLAAWVQITGKSAADFRHFNELSVYGDDHVLSMSRHAPGAWTWGNITNTMAQWNIVMREEVDTGGQGTSDLSLIPFLSKYCRKPDLLDRADWSDTFGAQAEVPAWIVYHNPITLGGKVAAAVTTTDPLKRTQRALGYLPLCAHNKDAYSAIMSAVNGTLSRYPHIREQVAPQMISYKKVMEDFYTRPLKLESCLTEEELEQGAPDVHEMSESVCIYGETTLVEVLIGAMSIIPDVFSAGVAANDVTKVFVQALRGSISWPKRLLQFSNSTINEGHLNTLTRDSAYSVLPADIKVSDADKVTPVSTLLVRHWLYLLLRQEKIGTKFWRLFEGFTSKIPSLQFVINGHCVPFAVSTQMPFYNLLLIAALNFVTLDLPVLEPLFDIRVPNVGVWLDHAVQSVINLFWARIPSSFNEMCKSLNTLHRGPLVVAAETGSGKSTTMVSQIAMWTEVIYSKVIVIVPRRAVAIGLAQYVSENFVVTASALVSGVQVDQDARVWYVTPGEILVNPSRFVGHQYVFVHDETHVRELDHQAARCLLEGENEAMVRTSATIEGVPIRNGPIMVPAMRPYAVVHTRHSRAVPDLGEFDRTYRSTCKAIVEASPPGTKSLIFVDSFAEMDEMDAFLGKETGFISSRHTLEGSPMVIIATSSADVGITVPGRDLIITKDTVRGVRDPMSRSAYTRAGIFLAGGNLMTQRCGRVGRTQNGFSHVVKLRVETERGVEPQSPPSATMLGVLAACSAFKGISGSITDALNPGPGREWLESHLYHILGFEIIGMTQFTVEQTSDAIADLITEMRMSDRLRFVATARANIVHQLVKAGADVGPALNRINMSMALAPPQMSLKFSAFVALRKEFHRFEYMRSQLPGLVTTNGAPDPSWWQTASETLDPELVALSVSVGL